MQAAGLALRPFLLDDDPGVDHVPGVVGDESLVQFGGETQQEADDKARSLIARLESQPNAPKAKLYDLPPMLDLIVAKAMAKLLEDRYQSIKELADDLREVRRQIDSTRPATALKASRKRAMEMTILFTA